MRRPYGCIAKSPTKLNGQTRSLIADARDRAIPSAIASATGPGDDLARLTGQYSLCHDSVFLAGYGGSSTVQGRFGPNQKDGSVTMHEERDTSGLSRPMSVSPLPTGNLRHPVSEQWRKPGFDRLPARTARP